MAVWFRLHHLDGAPLLGELRERTSPRRNLTESLAILDSEPVVVIDARGAASYDVDTPRELLTCERASATLVVIASPASPIAAELRRHHGVARIVVVDDVGTAAVRAACIQRRARARPTAAARRFRVRLSV